MCYIGEREIFEAGGDAEGESGGAGADGFGKTAGDDGLGPSAETAAAVNELVQKAFEYHGGVGDCGAVIIRRRGTETLRKKNESF